MDELTLRILMCDVVYDHVSISGGTVYISIVSVGCKPVENCYFSGFKLKNISNLQTSFGSDFML